MRICQRDIEKLKIQYHSSRKKYKKLATRAISAGHLASSKNKVKLFMSFLHPSSTHFSSVPYFYI